MLTEKDAAKAKRYAFSHVIRIQAAAAPHISKSDKYISSCAHDFAQQNYRRQTKET